jgi:alkanesulfonate monooxygenase SsuD/methylene tetrahydromethanopterin reductase-like flavin-dependent oxidoreductase (luciferase family)
MEFGAHLPLIAFDGRSRSLGDLVSFARQAAALDFRYLCANDHLLFGRPWLDGPTALAATLEPSAGMTLATTVALPVVRGPVQTAKLFSALQLLSGGRLIAGVGPGSSRDDYAAAGVPFEQRWTRFDESVRALRSLLDADAGDFSGTFYSTAGITIEPRPAGPPIWIASWGSAARLRQVARLGDGWLASGYNTTPAAFRANADALPDGFPNAIATMWLYATESRRGRERMLADVLAPALNRPVEALAELPLLIGSAEQCAERLSAYADAGAQRVFVWPLADELRQLETFAQDVAPLVAGHAA